MRRSILAFSCLSLLSALPAGAQQGRPSINSVDAAQKRTNAAICAKADADGDSYRPFVCDPRCDCLAPVLLQGSPTVCDESSPGVFEIGTPGPPTCNNGRCAGVGGSACVPELPATCPSGQQCVSSCSIFGCIICARRPALPTRPVPRSLGLGAGCPGFPRRTVRTRWSASQSRIRSTPLARRRRRSTAMTRSSASSRSRPRRGRASRKLMPKMRAAQVSRPGGPIEVVERESG